MRRFLKLLSILFAFLVIVAVGVPFLVPADAMKGQVLAAIEAHTGRKVSIDHLRLSVFPLISLDVDGVKISNPDWAGGGDMAQIKTLKLGLEWMPLLHKEVRLKELTLVQPILTLVKQQGKVNWDFNKESPASEPSQAPVSPANISAGTLSLEAIMVKDGTASYHDDLSPQTQILTAINITAKAADFSEKTELSFAALYRGKQAEVNLTWVKPFNYQKGKPSEAHLKVRYGSLGFTWAGTAALGKNGVPDITGTVTIPALNMADFEQKTSLVSPTPAPVTPSPHLSRWSDAPISFAGLSRTDADLAVNIGTLILPKTTLTNIHATLHLADGVLQLQADPASAYGGTIQFSANVNTAGTLALSFAAFHTQAEQVLDDFAGYDRLSGAFDMQAKLTAHGTSQSAWVRSLSGTGNFHCNDGKLKGVNLVGLLRNLVETNNTSRDAVTDFSDLSATYTITNGIIATNDLTINSPYLHVSGAGQADLPAWQEHFMLKAMLVASGSGSKTPSGIIVPVRVEGSIDHPGYRPDLAAAIEDNLKEPKALKQDLKDLRKKWLQEGGFNNLFR